MGRGRERSGEQHRLGTDHAGLIDRHRVIFVHTHGPVSYTHLDVIAQAQADIDAAFGQTVHAVQSSPYFLEITHPQATKSAAAARLAQLLAIDPSEIIAFGDSMNDLDLLQFAGCSVAVANAIPAVRTACSHITESNEADGVARALERLLFDVNEEATPWIID